MPTPSRLRWPAVLLLPLLVALVWAPGLDAPFVFDDVPAVVENPHLRELLPLSRSLDAPPQSPLSGRPVSAFSLALDAHVWGIVPRGFRIGNLVLHAAAALLLFGVVRRTLRSAVFGLRHADHGGRLALLCAALWAVHPLQTDAVEYVAQRTEVLCGALLLFTLWASLRVCDGGGPAWTALAVAGAFLAVGSKEVGFAAPLVVLAWDWVFAAGSPGVALRRRPVLYAGLFASWLPLAWLVAGGPRSDSVGFHHGVDPITWLLTQTGVLAHYARLVVAPTELHLTYDWPLVRDPLVVIGPVAALVACFFLTGVGLVRRKPLAFVGAACFLVLAPTSSLVPIVTEIVAERRMYLPSAALLSALVLVVWRYGAPALGRGATQLLVLALVAAAAFGTTQRLDAWRDVETLLRADVDAQPGNDLAHNLLGLELHRVGRSKEARVLFERARALRPRYAPYASNLARLERDLGRVEEAAALYEQAFALAPEDAEIGKQLALTWLQLGRRADAERVFAEVVRLAPDDPAAHWNLAGVLWESGRTEQALAEVEQVVRLDPSHAGARRLLAEQARTR